MSKAEKIMNEITEFCSNECSSYMSCPEEECVLFRIEKILMEVKKKKLTREEFEKLYRSYGFKYISNYNENLTREEAIVFLENLGGVFMDIYNDDTGEEDDDI